MTITLGKSTINKFVKKVSRIPRVSKDTSKVFNQFINAGLNDILKGSMDMFWHNRKKSSNPNRLKVQEHDVMDAYPYFNYPRDAKSYGVGEKALPLSVFFREIAKDSSIMVFSGDAKSRVVSVLVSHLTNVLDNAWASMNQSKSGQVKTLTFKILSVAWKGCILRAEKCSDRDDDPRYGSTKRIPNAPSIGRPAPQAPDLYGPALPPQKARKKMNFDELKTSTPSRRLKKYKPPVKKAVKRPPVKTKRKFVPLQ